MLQQKPGGMLQHLADSDSWFLSSQTPSAVYLITGMPRSGAKGCMGLRRRSQIDRFENLSISARAPPSRTRLSPPHHAPGWNMIWLLPLRLVCLTRHPNAIPEPAYRECARSSSRRQCMRGLIWCIYTYIHIRIHVYIQIYIYNIRVCICTLKCLYSYMYTYIFIHVYIHVCKCLYVYICTHSRTQTHTCKICSPGATWNAETGIKSPRLPLPGFNRSEKISYLSWREKVPFRRFCTCLYVGCNMYTCICMIIYAHFYVYVYTCV